MFSKRDNTDELSSPLSPLTQGERGVLCTKRGQGTVEGWMYLSTILILLPNQPDQYSVTLKMPRRIHWWFIN